LLTQVTDERFNPRAGFSRYYLNSGSELVTRMSSAVCPAKRNGRLGSLFRLNSGNELVARTSLAVYLVKHDGWLSRLFRLNSGNELVVRTSLAVYLVKHDGWLGRLFRLNSGNELVARASLAVCLVKRDGWLSRLFRFNSGNELVVRASLAVCLVKRDGWLSRLFRITGNLRRSRSFRASLGLAALHSHTILTQSVHTGLSTSPDNAPTGKEGKNFRRAKLREWMAAQSLIILVAESVLKHNFKFQESDGAFRSRGRAYEIGTKQATVI
jgi:hypothetical protein